MLVLSYWVTIERSRRAISSRELVLLSMYLSVRVSSVESLMLLVTPLMVRVLLTVMLDKELSLRPQVLCPDNPCMSLCRLVSRPLMLSCPLVEDSVSSSLVTDRLVKPLLLLILSLTRNLPSRTTKLTSNCTQSTLLLAKRDPLLLTLSSYLRTVMPSSTPSLLLLLLPRLLPFSIWLLTPVALSVSISETMASTPSSSMMIFPSKLLLTDRCPFF
mmetsp:Transcript_6546/g.4687  ORF Transcript_6546/g.4687 Transcript_6546/m.4687 type:complete len:216 (-) Transcript_6546:834-1481(-)